ncbi:hypothetical protein [Olleya sp. Bg11-27]|uniref:hypothetical protein n=1 Tax=Olleya sp. Bg11-27 TaxID=2058135 RepID=UPI000C317F0B|nr:hypothetical protein [Olleya sp. Bg11-27]AUC76675.1 hypothetical protein CW732_13740 [Olleya sp. Bg11-27]
MKNFLTYILLIFLFSCSSTQQKEKLIGNWYSNSDDNFGFFEFQFYNDSLIFYDRLGKTLAQWEVDKDKIHLTDINGFTNKKELTYSYKLNKSNELLTLKILGDTIIQFPELIKAKNTYDFFQKNIGIEIDLPIKSNELIPLNLPNNLIFNVYAGFSDNNFIVKTNSTSNLKNLEKEVSDFKKNLREELRPFARFNLIADKNITDFQMDSIKDQLKRTSIEQIFRTYKNKQADYENNLNWFGQKE